jgi:predicted MPP superfamily phosphohydrolase
VNKLPLLLLFSIVYCLIEWYAYLGLRALFQSPAGAWFKAFRIFYFSVSTLVLLGFFYYHLGNMDLLGKHGRSFLLAIIFIHCMGKLIFCIFVLLDDIQRFFRWLYHKLSNPPVEKSSEGISRSRFIVTTGLIVSAIPVLSMSWGIIGGAHDYRLRRIKVPVNNLPDGLQGLKIVQLSDIHSGSFWNRQAVMHGIEMVMEQGADLILFTGDLVNNRASEMEEWKAHFGKLTAPLGVYSTLGNHDYGDYVNWESAEAKRTNLQRLKDIQAEMGWQLLQNNHLTLEHRGEKLNVVGVENWSAKSRFPKYGNLQRAVQGIQPDLPTVLLSHDPSHWRAEVIENYPFIDLTLSGHTHGMQFGVEIPGFRWSPVQYVYDEWAGLYKNGLQSLYVNRGFGYIGYPGRAGILPEITLLTLERA